ncbi:MAG TPA: thiamine phosphate synthase [Polyangiales bacterium]|jgi:thiamine-phosphate pyrophosphorylase|nr:thiamine phosphate synthase [Polyangiales bacterium]
MRGFYAIVDPEHCAGRDARAVGEAILRGGCAILQLRAKRLDDEAFVALGSELAVLCRTHGVPLVVNDRVQLATRIGADGVHVGQTDLPIEEARTHLGSHVMISVSTHTPEQAVEAERRGADGIGFGPVFATRTKDNPDEVVGLHQLGLVCARASIPVIAIGGITAATAPEIRHAGAKLGAAISAVCGAADPEAAARELHSMLGGVRK